MEVGMRGKLTPTWILLNKSAASVVRSMKMLVASTSVAGGGRLKTVLVDEMEIGMLRFWHFLAVTAVARAKRAAADLNMIVVAVCVGGILELDG
jgi:hypothetical protein